MRFLIVIVACLVFLAGCYYRVTDPRTGKAYYTREIKHTQSGAVKFIDMHTGAKVVLQDSEVQEVAQTEAEASEQSGEF